jgi:hypothetical protein
VSLAARHPNAGNDPEGLKTWMTSGDVRVMERPPLTDVLASVLSAAVENTHRPALLAALQPRLRADDGRFNPGNVIPLQRRSVESHDQEPTPAA